MVNPIDHALGLRPLEDEIAEEIVVEEVAEEEIKIDLPAAQESKCVDLEAVAANDETLIDIEKARKNIERIIELGDESLDEMVALAKQSESPRAFEVASTMMKTLLDANRDFVEMSTRKKYAKEEILKPKEEEQSQTNVTNNNLILSTADLLKMLKGDA